MPISVTPVLSSNVGYEQDVPNQVASMMRYFIMNPGGVSDLWEDKLVSFRKLAAEWEHDPQAMASQCSSKLRTVLNDKFADLDFNVEVTTSDYKDEGWNGQYRLRFDITYTKDNSNRLPGMISGDIEVNSITNEIDIKFKPRNHS